MRAERIMIELKMELIITKKGNAYVQIRVGSCICAKPNLLIYNLGVAKVFDRIVWRYDYASPAAYE